VVLTIRMSLTIPTRTDGRTLREGKKRAAAAASSWSM
jgi:hypothetical protein